MRPAIPIAVAIAVVLLLAAVGLLRPASEEDSGTPLLNAGTALAEPLPLVEFRLEDQSGRAFGRGDLEGEWSLLFAGFTHCPDACPATLALLARLQARLHADGHPLRVVFLSVDPERDTPEQLARYAGYFGEHIVAATGQRAEIDALAKSLGLAYVRVPGSGEHYSYDHSTAVVLIDPAARLAGYFRPPLDLDAIERDLRAL